MRVVALLGAIAVSVTAQTTGARLFDLAFTNFDIPLVVVVLAALSGGAIVGLWAGTLAGFLQDVMSGGLVGVSGLAKSLVGVAVGILAKRLVRTGYGYRVLLIAVATIMNMIIFVGVYRLIGVFTPAVDGVDVLQQGILNVSAGVLIVSASELFPVLWRRIRKERMMFKSQRWRTN